ncbi:MAG: hypothetical protein AAF708_12160, partial [Deinococcota bacterium]
MLISLTKKISISRKNVFDLFESDWVAVAFRWAVFFGILARFMSGGGGYDMSNRHQLMWWISIDGFFIYVALTGLVLLFTKQRRVVKQPWYYHVQIISDIIFVSIFYFLSLSQNSDLFLLYFLPILMATSYLKLKTALSYFFAICIIFLLLVLSIEVYEVNLFAANGESDGLSNEYNALRLLIGT